MTAKELSMAEVKPSVDSRTTIPPLQEQYHKARKLYGLFSGLLMVWSLVGVRIEQAPIESLKVTLLNPEAVPVMLFFLVLYFAFRLTIEWYQCELNRRTIFASRVDFISAHCIGVISALLYSFQLMTKFRFADLANQIPLVGIIPFILLMVASGFFILRRGFLKFGKFASSKRNGTYFRLNLDTKEKKIAFGMVAFGLTVMAVISMYELFQSGSPISIAFEIGYLFACTLGIAWVIFFEHGYQRRKMAPAPPTGITIS